MRGAGRVFFAGTLLIIVGILNLLYGIGALDEANIFVGDARFILDNLNTLGWVLIVLGAIQLTGGVSLLAGHRWGIVVGSTAAFLGAIGALLSVGGDFPWWSLASFALCIYVLYGIAMFSEDERALRRGATASSTPRRSE